MSTNLPEVGSVVAPRGLQGIVATFGDIFSYVRSDHTLDSRWETDSLATVALPFSLSLSWDKSRSVDRIRCHKVLAGTFAQVFRSIQSSGLQSKITSFGGCYSFRPQRTGTRLSAHCWGIAIDLNPESNEQGTAGTMDPGIISAFEQAGFTWGGGWECRSRDPMHFQFCTGY